MDHLEKILEEVRRKDLQTKQKLNRRFIVIEGLYQNTGDIVPLKRVMELKNKYCYRLILDESNAIGVLGKTGRGTCEYFGVPVYTLKQKRNRKDNENNIFMTFFFSSFKC
jgi:serine palmitoyltransferase